MEDTKLAKVLVVDDEPNIVELLTVSLKFQNFEVYSANSGNEALRIAREVNPDAYILDVMMPGMDGFELLGKLRQEGLDGPVLYLTAKDGVDQRIHGLTIGADDYVTKPFSNRELVARVKANLRRGATAAKEPEEAAPAELTIGDLTIHPEAYMVTKRGETIELTHREFELLFYLAKHLGQVMTREHLLQTVWGYDYFGDVRTVDVTVRRLREKIEDNPSHPNYLVTRRGVGYYLRNPEQE